MGFAEGMQAGQDWAEALRKKYEDEDKNDDFEIDRPERKEKKSGGLLGGGGGGLMSMLSDKRSKEEITRLEGANTALTRALSARASYPDTRAPSPGMQALGQQAAPPSHASFPDSAHRVAAQNQEIAAQLEPPPPQQAPPPQPGGNPFAVNMQRPDMGALDEAYRRLGQGG